jgi:hypothetical protein
MKTVQVAEPRLLFYTNLAVLFVTRFSMHLIVSQS